ncbi:MAG: Uncharacterized protein G01um10145_971 [Microgenomates group bacterium Gr01-1014_5]|nr:MAG: Uncharacterized protein G01um10145_971 [Microgenomates group bacterium Gr01-1014_5]
MFAYLAQVRNELGGNVSGIGPLGNPTDVFSELPKLVSTIIGVMTVSAILWFIFQFILGGYKWISSAGDSKTLEAARTQLTQAIVGLIIVFGTLVLVSVLGNAFGVDVLNLERMLRQLGPGAPAPTGGGNVGP